MTTTTSKQNQGGMKHNLSKTKKLKAYRRLLRTLKNRSFKTKTAKAHRQQKIQYLKSRIRKLNQRKRTHKSRKNVNRTSNDIIVDNYVSPRVVPISSIAVPSVISSNAPVVENLPAPISASLPSTIPSASQEHISIDISPLTASTINTASTAQTDSSIPSVAPVVVPPPVLNTTPVMNTSPSTVGNSLHLSDLNVSNPPPASPSPTSMDTKTTVETASV
jgi:hypothetical protein